MRESSKIIEDTVPRTIRLVKFIIHSFISVTQRNINLCFLSLSLADSRCFCYSTTDGTWRKHWLKRERQRVNCWKRVSDRSSLSIDTTLVDEWFLREEQLFRNLELNSIATLRSLKWTSLQRSTIAHWLIATRTRIVPCPVMSNRLINVVQQPETNELFEFVVLKHLWQMNETKTNLWSRDHQRLHFSRHCCHLS